MLIDIYFVASTANLQAKTILQGHTSNITSVAFQSASQWLFTASTDGVVRIWDFPGLKCQKEFQNKSAINRAVLHPNQAEIIVGDESGRVRVLDLIKGAFTIEMVQELYLFFIYNLFSALRIMFRSLAWLFPRMVNDWPWSMKMEIFTFGSVKQRKLLQTVSSRWLP